VGFGLARQSQPRRPAATPGDSLTDDQMARTDSRRRANRVAKARICNLWNEPLIRESRDFADNVGMAPGESSSDYGAANSKFVALLGVVAGDDSLRAKLSRIAAEAVAIVGARSGSVLLAFRDEHGVGFHVGGAFGVGRTYQEAMDSPTGLAFDRKGAPMLAIESGEPFVVEDTERDEVFAPWRMTARAEHYRAVVAVPLTGGPTTPLGVLEVHRAEAGPWPEAEVRLLKMFAEHAGSAVRIAQLLYERERQVVALDQVVHTLREQSHEFANRLHTIGGLLALGDHDDARRFVAELESQHHSAYGAIVGKILPPALAGLILAQRELAEQQDVSLKLAAQSALDRLPSHLSDPQAVTIIGNLIQNAIDAVAEMPKRRRRVVLTLRGRGHDVMFRVRDWGEGIADGQLAKVFERGVSNRSDTRGFGLSLVSNAVEAAGGRIELAAMTPGTQVTVLIPNE
jgi:signal transduction histidine kinase